MLPDRRCSSQSCEFLTGVALADVSAVKAEQHYIRVLTAAKAYMVLHRFGEEIPVSGPYQVVVRQFVRSVSLPVTALTAES